MKRTMRLVVVLRIGLVLMVPSAAVAWQPTPEMARLGALADFWRDNDGKTVRRLPVGVMPENVFWSFTTRDFADGMKTFNRMADECLAKGTYNCVTLTLRCNPELGDAETVAAAKACSARAHREGVKVYMDTDPRIARREFFARWPNERQSIAKVVAVAATNGVAAFATVFDSRQDHMSWWADAYPASEFALGTFTVDDEGWLRVGSQRYTAFVAYRLSPSERAAFDALVKGRTLKTKFFDIGDVAGIVACLERAAA